MDQWPLIQLKFGFSVDRKSCEFPHVFPWSICTPWQKQTRLRLSNFIWAAQLIRVLQLAGASEQSSAAQKARRKKNRFLLGGQRSKVLFWVKQHLLNMESLSDPQVALLGPSASHYGKTNSGPVTLGPRRKI